MKLSEASLQEITASMQESWEISSTIHSFPVRGLTPEQKRLLVSSERAVLSVQKSLEPGQRILRWKDMGDTGVEIFEVWDHGLDLLWAFDTWAKLTLLGAAHFRSPSQQDEVVGRFLALGGFYRDFCWAAFDEHCQPDYIRWLREMDAGLNFSPSRARKDLLGYVLRAYRNETTLLEALWRSATRESHTWERLDCGRLKAFSWLQQGAPCLD